MRKNILNEFEGFRKKYGMVVFNGIEYVLTQQAYPDHYKNGVRYFSSAMDKNGNMALMEWETCDDWNEASELWETMHHESIMDDLPGILEEESNACDWDNPINVTIL